MIILHIETSTSVCSAAISENGECIKQEINTQDLNHAKLLSVFIGNLQNDLKGKGKKLDAVALSQGPGSYTGLRIGTATAKGLCFGLDIPLIAVDTLQIISTKALRHIGTSKNVLLCPMIDARRMEVYSAFYDENLQRISDVEANIIDADSFADRLNKSEIYFCGNGAGKCEKVITHPNAHFIADIYPEAAYMINTAETKFRNAQFENVAYFDPFYLKEFQATVSKKSIF